jgi:hypothetical protein
MSLRDFKEWNSYHNDDTLRGSYPYVLECGDFIEPVALAYVATMDDVHKYLITTAFRTWLRDWRKARIISKKSCVIYLRVRGSILSGIVNLPEATTVEPWPYPAERPASAFTECHPGQHPLAPELDSLAKLESYLKRDDNRHRLSLLDRPPQYNIQMRDGLSGVLYLRKSFVESLTRCKD